MSCHKAESGLKYQRKRQKRERNHRQPKALGFWITNLQQRLLNFYMVPEEKVCSRQTLIPKKNPKLFKTMRLFHHPSRDIFFPSSFLCELWKLWGLPFSLPFTWTLQALSWADLPVLLGNELTGKHDKHPRTASFPQGYYTPWARIDKPKLSPTPTEV